MSQSGPPAELQSLDIAPRIRTDDAATVAASRDFGGIINCRPAAVLYPTSEHDIVELVRCAYESPRTFPVTARGRGHSDRGQSVGTPGGVTVHMRSLAEGGARVVVSPEGSPGPYVDAGGEQTWSEVLQETLKYGLSPRSWLDYLDLTIGGTLSIGGMSGQAFKYGPQITTIYELDVITGKGEMITCSKDLNSDLFYATLGGLGQFGIITRARIALAPAPTRVRWVGLVFTDFEIFTRVEESLISIKEASGGKKGLDYLEGFVMMDHAQIKTWKSPFLTDEDARKMTILYNEHGGIYFLELAVNYGEKTASTIDHDIDSIIEGLNFTPQCMTVRDISYVEFLQRVCIEEKNLQTEGLWDIPHPWINLLVPKSRIYDFYQGVLKGIFKQESAKGVFLFYPVNKNKWDDRMSAMFPEEDIFYKVGFLLSSMPEDLESVLNQIEEMLSFCNREGIIMKQYMPHYETIEDWKRHFGSKWERFVEMKKKYDPKAILAQGHNIFTTKLTDDTF